MTACRLILKCDVCIVIPYSLNYLPLQFDVSAAAPLVNEIIAILLLLVWPLGCPTPLRIIVHTAVSSCGGKQKHPPGCWCTYTDCIFTLEITPDNTVFLVSGEVLIYYKDSFCSQSWKITVLLHLGFFLARLHLQVPCSCYQRGRS